VRRSLIVAIFVLALSWQGPALAYSAALTLPASHSSGSMPCSGPAGSACDDCCSHGSGFCAAACALALTAVIPAAVSPVVAILPGLGVPDADKPAPIERHPARLLRPPIV